MQVSLFRNVPGSKRLRRSGGKMTGEIIYATIFMVCFVLLGGVVMFLSRTIDAGEARFDSETGEQLPDEED